ncbi:MAG: hypothetical protein VCB59_12010, partial [Gammaproteobacteria bacterium]
VDRRAGLETHKRLCHRRDPPLQPLLQELNAITAAGTQAGDSRQAATVWSHGDTPAQVRAAPAGIRGIT